jgi:hypothetical protein
MEVYRDRARLPYIHSLTHTIIYDSSKSNDDNLTIRKINLHDDNLTLVGSGNESDYDNNQSMTVQISSNNLLNSNELIHTDNLLLGDQNEIILHDDTHFENP